MQAKRLTPILNVSNIAESFAWFERVGWTKGWDWGSPPTFEGSCSGECEIFLCENGQGGRGRDNQDRLAAIKKKYHPTNFSNFFRVNQNIRPAERVVSWPESKGLPNAKVRH